MNRAIWLIIVFIKILHAFYHARTMLEELRHLILQNRWHILIIMSPIFYFDAKSDPCPWRVPVVSMKKELVILLYKTTGGTHQERKSDKFREEAFNFEDTRF